MTRKKYFVLSIVCSLLSAAVVLLALWLPGKYQVPVLTYHAIAPSWHEPLNNVRPQRFEKQMAYLKARGYRVLTLDELVQGLRSGARPFHRSVVITFDDGYENNYTAAYPVLSKCGFPATIFVEVGHLGRPGRLTWEQAREMLAGGIAIESHVMTGAYLPGLPREALMQEVLESKKVLERRLGRPVHFMAYPIGGFSEEIKRIVREAGYTAAFTTNRGYDRDALDLYELKRIRIKDSDGEAQLWLKLSGYYNLFRSSKKPF